MAETGEQSRGGLGQIGLVAKAEHGAGAGQWRAESKQRLVTSHINRVQPHRQFRRIVRREQAGDRSTPCVSSPVRSGPMTASIASTVTPPGRNSMGAEPQRSSTVDSTPSGQGPLSSTAAMRPDKSSKTCCGVVGLTLPERFAEGAATGRPVARSSASAMSCAGTRTASVSSPALASRLTVTIALARQHQRQGARPERGSEASVPARSRPRRRMQRRRRDNGRSAD